MTAAQSAAARIRCGFAPGLAVTIAAREFGKSPREVASALAKARKPNRRTTTPVNAWWNK